MRSGPRAESGRTRRRGGGWVLPSGPGRFLFVKPTKNGGLSFGCFFFLAAEEKKKRYSSKRKTPMFLLEGGDA